MAKITLEQHLKKVESAVRSELAYYQCPTSTPWVLSLDLDDTILNVWRDDPALTRLAELTYGKIENKLTPEEVLQNQLKLGGIQIDKQLAVVHKIMPDDFLAWAFDRFDAVGIYSTATDEYIRLVTPLAHPDLLDKASFVLDRKSCFQFKHSLAKDLDRVAELDSDWHIGRIVHVDDRRYAFPRASNFIHNGKGWFDSLKEDLEELLTFDNLLEYNLQKRLAHDRETFDANLYGSNEFDEDLGW